MAGASRPRAGGGRLRRNVRCELSFQQSDLVLQVKLALLQALELKLILDRIDREAGDYVIEVSVLEVQLVYALPEHFTVGRMYHGNVPPYRLDVLQYRPNKNKKRASPKSCQARPNC
jgi:hypothetical protein